MMTFSLPSPGRAVRGVMIGLLGIFIACVALELAVPSVGPRWADWVGLWVPALFGFELWRLVTWALVHSTQDWSHIVYNLIALYFFGSGLEQQVGSRGVLRLLAVGGAWATVFVVVDGLARMALGATPPLVVGASGAISAVVAGWCLTNRHRSVLFFVIPMPAVALLALVIALDVVRALGGGLSLAAHLGGYAAGALWATGWTPRRAWLEARLWWTRRRLRTLRGGRDVRDTFH
jgi:membrane associated rhomboid family serine protease